MAATLFFTTVRELRRTRGLGRTRRFRLVEQAGRRRPSDEGLHLHRGEEEGAADGGIASRRLLAYLFLRQHVTQPTAVVLAGHHLDAGLVAELDGRDSRAGEGAPAPMLGARSV